MYEKSFAKWCRLLQEKYLDNLELSRFFTLLDPPKGSVTCEYMMASREVITSFIYWEVNNGKSINFWFDSWNGSPPLATIDSLKDFSNIVIQAWGTSFSNYV